MPTLFLSDLHLDAARPEALELFETLMDSLDDSIDALYILGDLFEFWNGDDDLSPTHQRIVDCLQGLQTRGVKSYFMAGNRDFLVGKRFARMTGMVLLPDPTMIDLYQAPCLLTHGDLLCTDDHAYQRFRRFTHIKWIQLVYRCLPLSLRRSISDRVRRVSVDSNQKKAAEIMDVNQSTVEVFMREYAVSLLIHGHTHRPGVHHFKLDQQAVKRIVLGDWYEGDSILVCGRGCQELMQVRDFLRSK